MRADYCPIGGEPCQSLCIEPCSVRKSVDFAVVKQLIEALEQLMSIVTIHSRSTSNSFAWAEMDEAKAALAAAKEAGL